MAEQRVGMVATRWLHEGEFNSALRCEYNNRTSNRIFAHQVKYCEGGTKHSWIVRNFRFCEGDGEEEIVIDICFGSYFIICLLGHTANEIPNI